MKKKEKRNLLAEKLLALCENHREIVIPFVFVSTVVITTVLMRVIQIVVSCVMGNSELGNYVAFAIMIVLAIFVAIRTKQMEKEEQIKNENTSDKVE